MVSEQPTETPHAPTVQQSTTKQTNGECRQLEIRLWFALRNSRRHLEESELWALRSLRQPAMALEHLFPLLLKLRHSRSNARWPDLWTVNLNDFKWEIQKKMLRSIRMPASSPCLVGPFLPLSLSQSMTCGHIVSKPPFPRLHASACLCLLMPASCSLPCFCPPLPATCLPLEPKDVTKLLAACCFAPRKVLHAVALLRGQSPPVLSRHPRKPYSCWRR